MSVNAESSNQPSFIRGLVWFEETLIAYTLGLMTLVAFANVVARRVFSASFTWSLELTLFLFLALVLFGMSYTARKALHISVDVIVDLFPAAFRRVASVFAGLVSMLYAGMLCWGGYVAFSKFVGNPGLRRIATEELHIPRFVIYGFFAAAFAYLFLTLLYMTWQIAIGRKDSLTAAHEAEDLVEEAFHADNEG